MTVDCVWVCKTCNSYCYPGWRDIFSDKFYRYINSSRSSKVKIKYIEKIIRMLRKTFDNPIQLRDLVCILEDLRKWILRHKDHQWFLTNDHMFMNEYTMKKEKL